MFSDYQFTDNLDVYGSEANFKSGAGDLFSKRRSQAIRNPTSAIRKVSGLAPSMGHSLRSAFQAPSSSMMPASSPTHGIGSTGHHSRASMGPPSLPMSMKTSNTIQLEVHRSGGPPVLRSAFMPPRPVKWTRSCEMVKVAFTRVMATYAGDGLHVKFVSNPRKTEFIEVAKEYNVPGNAGRIGMGYSKVGIYVCRYIGIISSTTNHQLTYYICL